MFDKRNENLDLNYAGEKSIDLGLQAHMRKVYNVMVIGLAITGIVAYVVANTEAIFNLIFGTPLQWVAIFAPLAFLWLGMTPNRIAKMTPMAVGVMFVIFASIFGISLATIFKVYSGDSIARVFFITAGMFAGISIYGYTTKKDLSGVGSFMIMGLIGIIIAAIVNIFLQSEMMYFVISVIGVIVFTGLTAWDTQRIKESYSASYGHDANTKMAVMGALSLYLNFILLFQHLLSLLGSRE